MHVPTHTPSQISGVQGWDRTLQQLFRAVNLGVTHTSIIATLSGFNLGSLTF